MSDYWSIREKDSMIVARTKTTNRLDTSLVTDRYQVKEKIL